MNLSELKSGLGSFSGGGAVIGSPVVALPVTQTPVNAVFFTAALGQGGFCRVEWLMKEPNELMCSGGIEKIQ